MDAERSHDPLSDAALDRELRQAISVEPSPEFVARIRMRVASEQQHTFWLPRRLGAIASAGAAIAIAILVFRSGDPGRTAPVSHTRLPAALASTAPSATIPAPGNIAAPPLPLTERLLRSSSSERVGPANSPRPRQANRGSQPEVIVSHSDAEAMRQFMAAVLAGEIDVRALRALPTAETFSAPRSIEPPAEITVDAIEIEPIGPIAQGLEGL